MLPPGLVILIFSVLPLAHGSAAGHLEARVGPSSNEGGACKCACGVACVFGLLMLSGLVVVFEVSVMLGSSLETWSIRLGSSLPPRTSPLWYMPPMSYLFIITSGVANGADE